MNKRNLRPYQSQELLPQQHEEWYNGIKIIFPRPREEIMAKIATYNLDRPKTRQKFFAEHKPIMVVINSNYDIQVFDGSTRIFTALNYFSHKLFDQLEVSCKLPNQEHYTGNFSGLVDKISRIKDRVSKK